MIIWWSFNGVSNFVFREVLVIKWGWRFEKVEDLVYGNIIIIFLFLDVIYSIVD